MRMKRLIVIASLVLLSCSASAECIFSELPQEGRPYRLSLSDAECKLVRYNGENVVTIFVNYPSMEVVRERALDKALVAFQLVYISKSTFNQDAIFEGQQPLIIKDGVEEYKIAGQIIRRFVGLDGGVARVTEGLHIHKASHLFNYEIDVRYQYTLEHESVKEMDDFAVTFLQKITRK